MKDIISNIKKDIDRTLTDHPIFKIPQYEEKCKTMLNNILVAYSNYNRKLGYCQGMNYIAAFLLINSGLREEESFWMLVVIMENNIENDFLNINGIEGLYHDYLPLLRIFNELYKIIMQKEHNDLLKYFEDQQFFELMYIDKWILTLFLYSLPFQACIRIFDGIFSQGYSFILSFTIALVLNYKEELKRSNFQEMYDRLDKLKLEINNEIVEKVFLNALNLNVNWVEIEKERIKLQLKFKVEEKELISKFSHNIESEDIAHFTPNIQKRKNKNYDENKNEGIHQNLADSLFRKSHFLEISELENNEFSEEKIDFEILHKIKSNDIFKRINTKKFPLENHLIEEKKRNLMENTIINPSKKNIIVPFGGHSSFIRNSFKINRVIDSAIGKRITKGKNPGLSTFGKAALKTTEDKQVLQVQLSNKKEELIHPKNRLSISDSKLTMEQKALYDILQKSISKNKQNVENK